tara:strand:- start:9376 stop:10326 length:951 start_codon:yes stop_codon:yes gene_type:complete
MKRITLVKDLESYNKNLKVLVIGGSGQVGTEIKNQNYKTNLQFFFPSSNELNLASHSSIKNFLNNDKFDYIINLGAYTDVNGAETKRSISNTVNNLGVKLLSKEADSKNINLIHTSTDYVFGGNLNAPFHPGDKKAPINYYGLTKSDGEDAVLTNHKSGIIIRFSSVFSQYGNNFVKNIIKLLLTTAQVRVVSDQKISLTFAEDFSRNIKQLIDLYIKNIETNDRIFHFCSPGFSTWYSVAKIIFDELETILQKSLDAELIPISLSEWESDAKRSIDTRLYTDFDYYLKNDIKFSSWEDSVKLVVRKVLPKILKEI